VLTSLVPVCWSPRRHRTGAIEWAVGAIRYTAGLELRHARRVVVALTVLVGLGGALVLTLVAGARRADTSYERFRDATSAADVSVTPSEVDEATFDAIEHLPQVVASQRPLFPFIVPAESGLYPFLDFLAYVDPDRAEGSAVDLPRVLAGRLPHPDRAGEMAIIERFADEAGLDVGDRVEFESYAPEQFEGLFGTGDVGAPAGPRMSATVTGIVDAPDFLSEREANFLPRVMLTPAFLARYGEDVGIYPGGINARLRNGEADIPAFSAAVRRLIPDDAGLEIQPASDVSGRIDDGLRVLVVGLLLCAACAALAVLVAISLAVSRHLARSPGEQTTMRWLGMTRRERALASVVAMLPVAIGGAAVAVVLAFALSPTMPVGIAREADPDLGLSFDPLVLGLGFLGVALAVALIAGAAAWQTTRFAARVGDADHGPATPAVFRRATPIAAPVARPLGVRMALEPGRGATAVPVRAAALGAALGVLGLVTAIVFATSLTTTIDTPARFGFPWDVVVAGFQGDRAERLVDDLRDDERVAGLGVLHTGIAIVGDRDINAYAVDEITGAVGPTLLDGRTVRADDEVVLGAGTARHARVGIGDDVIAHGTRRDHRLAVVGIAAFPLLDDRAGVDSGALVTVSRLRTVADVDDINRDVVVRWAPGLDARAETRALERAVDSEVFLARLPSDLANLERVQALPWVLAAFLAIVAVLAIAHAVVSTVRRRRRDLAILRTLGLVDRQLSALVRWEGSTFAVIGLLVGIPLGVVAGRIVWQLVADRMGIDPAATLPVPAIVVIAVATMVVALAAAAIPARDARRVQPARTLAANG
jgi:hypothetical protein